ncbi:unannotated protein [freshwater metagenome]|uniref:Unannotated protein n=1 Tax=freshwater metagenome TaxID=449393 RepID=A0A6J7C2Z8_9ZZZZ
MSDPVPVDRQALLGVEARGVGLHPSKIEELSEFSRGEELEVVARRPSQQRQIVEQPLGKVALLSVEVQRALGVALGELLVALPHDEWQVAKLRRGAVAHADRRECVVHRELARRAREEVLAAQHVSDRHQSIVDGVYQGVERLPVATHDDEVGYMLGGEGHLTAHEINPRPGTIGHPQAQHWQAALGAQRGLLLIGQIAIGVVIAEFRVLARGAAAILDLIWGAE